MEDSQSNTPNSQPRPTDAQQEAHFEDETNLIDYFKVVWKWKYFILLGSVLPVLIISSILFLLPRSYKVTYTYNNWNLNGKEHRLFLTMFYSQENTSRIIARLPDYNRQIVNFEAWPSYADLKKTMADALAPAQDLTAKEIEQIWYIRPQLLNMTLTCRSEEESRNISSIIRDNFENTMSLYLIEHWIIENIRQHKNELISIDENKLDLRLTLEKTEKILSGLKRIGTKITDRVRGDVTLQFDISGKTEYLPLEYQVQAVESKIIELQEQIIVSEKKYGYLKKLLAINEKLLEELKKGSANYTIKSFCTFSTNLLQESNDIEPADYLNSYINRLENRMSASVPVTDRPEIIVMSKKIAKKTTIAFLITLAVSVFVAFLLEGIQKSKLEAS